MKINLIPATINDLDEILRMQKEAFAALLEKYRDYDTSPAAESYNDILRRFNMPETVYYFIIVSEIKVGVIRIVDSQDGTTRKRISPIFIRPAYQNRG